MAEIGTTEAATALADYFGAQLNVGHDEGRQMMADALHQQFDISRYDARRLVDALERAGTIRWIAQRTDTDVRVSASGSTPVVGAVTAGGYWQLEPA